MTRSVVDLEREVRVATSDLGVRERSYCARNVGDKPILNIGTDAMGKTHTSKTTCIGPLGPKRQYWRRFGGAVRHGRNPHFTRGCTELETR